MFRKKPIILNLYTYNKAVYETARPKWGKEREKPNWLKELKTSMNMWWEHLGMWGKTSTVAICPGIREYLSTPIQQNMWADLDIRINPDGTFTNSSEMRPWQCMHISEHPDIQWKNMYTGKRIALKLDNPWKAVSDSSVPFMMCESHYSTNYFRDKKIWTSPGVTNYKYQHSLNVHLNVPVKDEPYIISLKYDSPLISYFPMTERPVEIKYHLISESEWQGIGNHMPQTMIGRYYRQKGVKKEA